MFRAFLTAIVKEYNTVQKTVTMYAAKFLSFKI